MAHHQLDHDGQSLPLDRPTRYGLIGMAVVASCSLIPSVTLFFYICYKLISWRLYARAKPPVRYSQTTGDPKSRDYTLGIEGVFTETEHNSSKNNKRRSLLQTNNPPPDSNHFKDLYLRDQRQDGPNQFLVLILNLFLADIHQSLAFALNLAWLHEQAIQVGTPTCFVQGFLVSVGDLASSTFITIIAVHTYVSVVAVKKIPQRQLYAIIVAAWVFVYLISTIPIGATRNGASRGGFFVRAGTWCWINDGYETLRLVTHYLFIFIGLFSTSALYIIILITTRRRSKMGPGNHGSTVEERAAADQSGTSRAFLMYPFIYVTCTLPLAIGRVATMAGADVPLKYMAIAGAMMAANGFFDCLLFGTTRKVIIFGAKEDVNRANVGLDTFAFMKTPKDRLFGNMIWVQGGRHHHHQQQQQSDSTTTKKNYSGGWLSQWSLFGPKSSLFGPQMPARVRLDERNTSEETLRGPATIQMNTVTTVVVETDTDKEHMGSLRPHFYWRSSDSRSVKSDTDYGDDGSKNS